MEKTMNIDLPIMILLLIFSADCGTMVEEGIRHSSSRPWLPAFVSAALWILFMVSMYPTWMTLLVAVANPVAFAYGLLYSPYKRASCGQVLDNRPPADHP